MRPIQSAHLVSRSRISITKLPNSRKCRTVNQFVGLHADSLSSCWGRISRGESPPQGKCSDRDWAAPEPPSSQVGPDPPPSHRVLSRPKSESQHPPRVATASPGLARGAARGRFPMEIPIWTEILMRHLDLSYLGGVLAFDLVEKWSFTIQRHYARFQRNAF